MVALLALLVPELAWAQTCPNINITVNSVVPRYSGATDTPGNLFPLRPQNLQPTWINYNDCINDIRLQFTILVGGLPCSDTIQVWAGTVDCTQTSARQANSGATHCWPVTGTGAFAMAASSTGDIRAPDIVRYVTDDEPPTIFTGVGPLASAPEVKKACQSQASPGGVSVSLYFMAIEADGQTVDGTSGEYDFGADLVGPYAPTNVTAGVGEDLIVVNWTPAVDSTIQGFNIYCQDQGAIVKDAGTVMPEATLVCPDTGVVSTVPEADIVDGEVVDTGVMTPDAAGCHFVNLIDAGGPGGSSCVSSVLVNEFEIGASAAEVEGGVAPEIEASAEASVATGGVGISDIPGMYLCGQVGGNTTSSYTVQNFSDGGPGIKDGTEYAVTVAATDDTGNIGVIGNLSCVIPAPVITFWSAYTSDGGLAGGGFCALEGPGMPVSGSLFGIGMGVAAITLARRRRRHR
jgi:hypothetical protein